MKFDVRSETLERDDVAAIIDFFTRTFASLSTLDVTDFVIVHGPISAKEKEEETENPHMFIFSVTDNSHNGNEDRLALRMAVSSDANESDDDGVIQELPERPALPLGPILTRDFGITCRFSEGVTLNPLSEPPDVQSPFLEATAVFAVEPREEKVVEPKVHAVSPRPPKKRPVPSILPLRRPFSALQLGSAITILVAVGSVVAAEIVGVRSRVRRVDTAVEVSYENLTVGSGQAHAASISSAPEPHIKIPLKCRFVTRELGSGRRRVNMACDTDGILDVHGLVIGNAPEIAAKLSAAEKVIANVSGRIKQETGETKLCGANQTLKIGEHCEASPSGMVQCNDQTVVFKCER